MYSIKLRKTVNAKNVVFVILNFDAYFGINSSTSIFM